MTRSPDQPLPLTIDDYAAAAEARLPGDVWDFIEGGAGSERTLAANRAAFDRTPLRPRVLAGVDQADTSVTVLGRQWSAPIAIAPMAYHTLVHPDGEVASARAADRRHLPMIVAFLAGRDWQEIRASTSSPLWLQLYPMADWTTTAQLVRRAVDLGFEALVLTVDAPRLGRRLRDLRNGFRLPDHIEPVNLPSSVRTGAGVPAAHARAQFDGAMTWDMVARLREISSLPLLLKGVMTGEDAQLAVNAGVDGLIVSNHGGRQLDGVAATMDVLPEVVAATAGSCPVLLDGGVRRGGDVLAALARGAAAVLVGRPVLHGLATAGEDGVAGVLRLLGEETEDAMSLAGLASTAHIDHRVVSPGPVLRGSTAAGSPLPFAELHASLRHPTSLTMTFLNEITTRYPQAISFAPGRPFEDEFDPEDLFGYLRTYLEHLKAGGHSEEQIRQTLFQYGPTAGTIRDILARSVRQDEGIAAPAEAFVVTVGAQEALLITLRALCADDRDVLLVTDPCYLGVTGAAHLLGIEPRAVPETADGPDLDALADILAELRARGSRARLLYVVPDASNPSGVTMSEPARRKLLQVLRPYGTLVLEDTPYRLLNGGPRPPTLKALDRHQQVIHVGSFAKTAFPGARLGYVIADQVVRYDGERTGLLAGELAKVKSMVSVNTSPISQALVAGLLLSVDHRLGAATVSAARRYVDQMECLKSELERHFPAERRDRLGVHWNDPPGGFFLSLTVPFAVDDDLLRHCAEQFGVLWTPMSYFHVESGGRRAIRLSSSYLRPDQIVTGVERLTRFIVDTVRR